MISCPNCQHKEINGAIYCSKCGAQLVDARFATHKIEPPKPEGVRKEIDRVQPLLPCPCNPGFRFILSKAGRSYLGQIALNSLWAVLQKANPLFLMLTFPLTTPMLMASPAPCCN